MANRRRSVEVNTTSPMQEVLSILVGSYLSFVRDVYKGLNETPLDGFDLNLSELLVLENGLFRIRDENRRQNFPRQRQLYKENARKSPYEIFQEAGRQLPKGVTQFSNGYSWFKSRVAVLERVSGDPELVREFKTLYERLNPYSTNRGDMRIRVERADSSIAALFIEAFTTPPRKYIAPGFSEGNYLDEGFSEVSHVDFLPPRGDRRYGLEKREWAETFAKMYVPELARILEEKYVPKLIGADPFPSDRLAVLSR